MFSKIIRIPINYSAQNKNPNCILNVLTFISDKNLKSSGLGRDFSVAHDGRHVRGNEEKEGSIIVIAPLTGTLVYQTLGSPEDPKKLKGNRIINIKLDKHPFVAIYKDLLEVKVKKGTVFESGNDYRNSFVWAGSGERFSFYIDKTAILQALS